jgi:aspartate kinase
MDQSNIIVMKYGGTSQKNTTYNMILKRINENKDKKFVIVLSAMSGVTNKLLQYESTKDTYYFYDVLKSNSFLAKQVNVEIDDICDNINKLSLNLNSLENVISFIAQGEYLTCNILYRFLNANGIDCDFISSLDVIESNCENFGIYNKGEFIVHSEKIINSFKTKNVVIIPGFSARTPSNKTCLLGRGGSDTTGSILAAKLNASSYEIWTDVNGIYSSDPRKIHNTFINEIIDYKVAQEVAAMGAKVIHPYCIIPCARKNIPIYIKNTFKPNETSTIICNNSSNDVYAITLQDNVKVFKITSFNMWNNYGFVHDIFTIFKEYNVDINIINTSQFNITTTTDENDMHKLWEICAKLELMKYQVELTFNNSIVSVVGNNIKYLNNIGELFKIIQKFNIITTSYSSNDMTLSFVINTDESLILAQSLHNTVFIDKI